MAMWLYKCLTSPSHTSKHWWFSGKIGHCQLLLICLAPGSIPGQCIFASPRDLDPGSVAVAVSFAECAADRSVAR